MAITAHFITSVDGNWVLKTVLLAFKHVGGAHSGANLAKEVFAVLEEAEVLHKVTFVSS